MLALYTPIDFSRYAMTSKLNYLTILYHDDFIIAIDKPPGLLVHRTMLAKQETEFAMQLLRDQLGQHVYPVHRLDRPTSGVLLFALSSEVAAKMTLKFTQRLIAKEYRAIVRGHIADHYSIDYPLVEIHDKYADARAKKNKPAQAAQSELHCNQRFCIPLPAGRYQSARFSLVDLKPITGRKHQLRRHMAHIRHPILGDTTHGDGKQNKFLRHHFNFASLALTCTCMEFVHPVIETDIKITAPLHQNMLRLLNDWQPFRVKGDENLNTHKVITAQ